MPGVVLIFNFLGWRDEQWIMAPVPKIDDPYLIPVLVQWKDKANYLSYPPRVCTLSLEKNRSTRKKTPTNTLLIT